MNTEYEALRLAKLLDEDMCDPEYAAAELRRLHEENRVLKLQVTINKESAQIAQYSMEKLAATLSRERESFKSFLREMHADHNDQHNHFHWALNEWVRRTEATQGETK